MQVATPSTYETYLAHTFYMRASHEFPIWARIVRTILTCVLMLVTKILWRWRVQDQSQLNRFRTKSHIVVMNHVSSIEPLLTMLYFSSQHIPLRIMYKKEFNTHALVALLFSLAGGIPVDRDTVDMISLGYATDALKRGEWLLIYPEGTRVKNIDAPNPIHAGFAFLAKRTHADVVLGCVTGAYSIARTHNILQKFSRVALAFAHPVTLDELVYGTQKNMTDTSHKPTAKEFLRMADTSAMDKVYAMMQPTQALFHTKR